MKPPVPTDLGWRGGQGDGPWGRPVSSESLRRLAIGLFIVSLGVLFAASLIGYIVIRLTGPGSGTSVALPRGLWVSTGVLLGSGVALAMARRAARAGSIKALRVWLPGAWALGIAFLVVQTPSVVELLGAHHTAKGQGLKGAQGLVFVLIVLHALHVIGGLVPLTSLAVDLLRGRLSPGGLSLLRSSTTYWHFLELVWITLFATFLAFG